jgi:RimJ/RimL family protein N-acetyltransferase
MERSAENVLLETGRLVLRQFTMSDVDNLAALDADPEVTRFITGGLATSREEITDSLLPGFMAWYR